MYKNEVFYSTRMTEASYAVLSYYGKVWLFDKFFIFCIKKDDRSRLEISVVRQILLVRNHQQDFLYAKKRNPSYD